MSRAARSCRDANSKMGPCGLVPSLLHRHLPVTPRRPCRRTGRPLDRPARGRAAAAPRPWAAARRRGRAQAAAGLCDRVLVILVVLRFQLPHQALAVLVGVDRATLTRAVHEVRPLLARRGRAVPGQQQPGVRLRRLADVFAYADASETQVRRPRAHRPGRRAYVGQALAEHDQDDHLQPRAGADAVERRGAAGTDARPDRGQHRGHR